MSSDQDMDLDERLGSLPTGDVDERLTARIRGRAGAVLSREQKLRGRPGLRRASRVYSRVIEPALVASACVLYAYWGVSATLALMQ